MTADLRDLENYYHVNISPQRIQNLGEFFSQKLGGLVTMFDFEGLDQGGKVDWFVFALNATETRELINVLL